MEPVLNKLEKDTFVAFLSFQNKYLKASSRKPHLLTGSDIILHINVGWIGSVVAGMKIIRYTYRP